MRIPSLHSLVDAVRAIGQQRVAETVLEKPTRTLPVTERNDTSKKEDSNRNS